MEGGYGGLPRPPSGGTLLNFDTKSGILMGSDFFLWDGTLVFSGMDNVVSGVDLGLYANKKGLRAQPVRCVCVCVCVCVCLCVCVCVLVCVCVSVGSFYTGVC